MVKIHLRNKSIPQVSAMRSALSKSVRVSAFACLISFLPVLDVAQATDLGSLLAALKSPLILRGDSHTAHRDPLIFYENGTFYLFYSYVREEEDHLIYWYVAFSTSKDLANWTAPTTVTPKGQDQNFASPGNVFRLLSAGGVDVAQPDLAYCGGISEALKIRALAAAMGVNVIPHVWGTMFNLAAAVHFLANTFVEPGRKEAASAWLERDRTAHPLRDELFDVSVEIAGANARVPDRPGLGVTINPSTIKKYLVKQTQLD